MTFPVWTLLINVAGSVILGFLMRFAVDGAPLPATTRAFLTTGFCGGFTTFSTFSYESVSLVEAGDWMRGSGYVVASVVLSLGGALAGMMAAHALAVARSGAAAG
jgi:CrcB protein